MINTLLAKVKYHSAELNCQLHRVKVMNCHLHQVKVMKTVSPKDCTILQCSVPTIHMVASVETSVALEFGG